jgi:hypothetical protein
MARERTAPERSLPVTYDDLVTLALNVTGLSQERWDFLQETMKDDAAMNRLMKSEWNEESRSNEAVIRDYYRKSDIWFANTFNSGYDGLLKMANRETHSPNEWQREFLKSVPPKGVILDYGAGFLRDSWKFVTLGYRVHVAEIQGPVTLFLWRYRALAKLQEMFHVVEVNSSTPVTDRYEGIACFEVLEHLLDPVALTRHLYDHLVPRGPFVYSASFGDPEHAPYHVASNAPLGQENVWNQKMREIGFVHEWSKDNKHLWKRSA